MQVTPGNVQFGCTVRPPLLLEQKGPVCRTHQTIGAGDHIKLVVGLLLAGMVYQQEAAPRSIGKVFQTGYHFIIACITVLLGPGLPDFLQGVDDNEPGVPG